MIGFLKLHLWDIMSAPKGCKMKHYWQKFYLPLYCFMHLQLILLMGVALVTAITSKEDVYYFSFHDLGNVKIYFNWLASYTSSSLQMVTAYQSYVSPCLLQVLVWCGR